MAKEVMLVLTNGSFTCHVKASPNPLIKEEKNDFNLV
jgi:hypothetical protein